MTKGCLLVSWVHTHPSNFLSLGRFPQSNGLMSSCGGCLFPASARLTQHGSKYPQEKWFLFPGYQDLWVLTFQHTYPHKSLCIFCILSFSIFVYGVRAYMSICAHLFVYVGTHVWSSAHAAREWYQKLPIRKAGFLS